MNTFLYGLAQARYSLRTGGEGKLVAEVLVAENLLVGCRQTPETFSA